jgi:hypothetical protein
MKPTIAGMAVATMIAGSAFAQTSQPPPADPLAVKPIPSQAQSVDSDTIRTKIGRAGYTEVTDLSRDSIGVWRARARKGREAVDIIVVFGEAHLRRILTAYTGYYNEFRTHLSLDKDSPAHRPTRRYGQIAARQILADFIINTAGYNFQQGHGSIEVRDFDPHCPFAGDLAGRRDADL